MNDSSRPAVRLGIAAVLLLALFGTVAWTIIILGGVAQPLFNNIFFRLYGLHELPFMVLLALFAIAMAIVMRTAPADAFATTEDPGVERDLPPLDARRIALVSGLVLLVTLAATRWVMHGLLFSMDEYSVDFQARLFAAGRLSGTVPGAWNRFAMLITPIFVAYNPASGSWITMYLPVYSALKAPFVAVGAGALLNPLLAALAVAAMALASRRLWPGERLRPWVAIALLATSSEFVVTSASGYSMPAHLAVNLVWLWLYLRDDALSWAGALVIGALAIGLHQPFPHALFVAPFLLRLLRDRRWDRLVPAALVYGAASVFWLLWIRSVQPVAQASHGGLASVFAFPTRQAMWIQGMDLALLFSWQAPIVAALVVAALWRRRLPPVLADLALGVLLTLGLYLCYPATQGHGWGYRYAYQVIGNLALLAAAGVVPLRESMGTRRALRLTAAALVVALVVQLPWRLLQVERFVRPFAAANAYVQSRSADVVLLEVDSTWYARDLVRNDPLFRTRPVVVRSDEVRRADREALRAALPGRVVVVTDAELHRLGMTRWKHWVP